MHTLYYNYITAEGQQKVTSDYVVATSNGSKIINDFWVEKREPKTFKQFMQDVKRRERVKELFGIA